MSKVKQLVILRPMDIAWQAFQAAADLNLYEDHDREFLRHQFKAWWAKHPQTKPDGGLK